MALTTNLLAVLKANANNVKSNDIENYHKIILAKRGALKNLNEQCTASETPTARAFFASSAFQLIFGNTKTITPQSSNYTAEKKTHWLVLTKTLYMCC